MSSGVVAVVGGRSFRAGVDESGSAGSTYSLLNCQREEGNDKPASSPQNR